MYCVYNELRSKNRPVPSSPEKRVSNSVQNVKKKKKKEMHHIATHLSHLNPLCHLRAFAVAGEYTEVLVVQPIRWDIYGGDPL
jgi:hypothetical protein